MGAVLRFIAWVLRQAWRWGVSIVRRVASWARSHWRTVYDWIIRGVAWDTIVRWIRERLGI